MLVGRYYLEKKDYTGAINRFKVVVTRYQTTRHVEEALMRLTEAYMALGIVEEAQTAAAVLGHNFPDSEWYSHAYSAGENRRRRAVREPGLLDQQGFQEGRAGLGRSGPGLPEIGILVAQIVAWPVCAGHPVSAAILVKISHCGGYWIIRFRG